MVDPYVAHMDGYRSAMSLAHECQIEANNNAEEKEKYWLSEKARHLERASFYLSKAKYLNKFICVADGCLKKTYKRRYCTEHYKNLCDLRPPKTSKRRPIPHSVPMAILRECEPGEGCIFWYLGATAGGYAQTTVNGERRYVHEILCEEEHGSRPSKKHQVAHSCGNGKSGCVNRNHLRWATPKENASDKYIHGTVKRGVGSPLSTLTEDQVIEIIKSPKSAKDKDLAKQYGSYRQTIYNIRIGNSWKHIHKMLENER